MSIATVNLEALPLYYRAGKGVNPQRTLLAVGLITASALVVGPLFAILQRLVMMFSIKLSLVVVIFAAWGLGYIYGRILFWQRIHSRKVTLGLASFGALAFLVTTWSSWPAVVAIHELMTAPGNGDFTASDALWLMLPPSSLKFIAWAYENGTWSMGDNKNTISGIGLGVMWAAEIVTSIGFIFYTAWQAVNKLPYCETCDQWGVHRALVTMAVSPQLNLDQLRQNLEKHNFGVLPTLYDANNNGNFLNINLQGCFGCDNLHTLCVDHVATKVNKKNEVETKVKPVVKRLNLNADQTVAIATLAAEIKALSEAPSATTLEPAPTAT